MVNFFEMLLKTHKVFICGETGVGKSLFYRQLIEKYFYGKRVVASDPDRELRDIRNSVQGKDIHEILALTNIPVDLYYLSECRIDNAQIVLNLMSSPNPLLATIQASNVHEAVNQLLLKIKLGNPSKQLDKLRSYLKHVRPFFVLIGQQEGERKITDLVEYGDELRHVHPI